MTRLVTHYLVGAQTRIHLDGRYLTAATGIVLTIGAADIARAEVTFYELDENRKFVWDEEIKLHRTHTVTTAVKDIRKHKDGHRMIFDLVTLAKDMDKEEQDALMALITRSSKPLEEEKPNDKVPDSQNTAK